MVRFFSSKKCISAVISLSLLMLVSVFSFYYLYGWFDLFKSDLEIKVDAKNFDENFEILEVSVDSIRLRNNFANDLTLNNIKIDDIECDFAWGSVINNGVVDVRIGNCTQNLQSLQNYGVSVFTNYGIKNEYEIIRNPITSQLIVKFVNGPCDFSSGYIRLFGLSDLDNAHAELSGSSLYTYNACIRHVEYTLGTSSEGNFVNLFYLTEMNNSAIWTNKSSILVEPINWFNVSLSSSGGSFDYIISSTSPGLNYACLAAIDVDNIMGSHIGTCTSSMPDKIWLKLE